MYGAFLGDVCKCGFRDFIYGRDVRKSIEYQYFVLKQIKMQNIDTPTD